MILKQYYLGCLAHASYLIADEASGEAAVVDPQRDVDRYLADAQAQGLTIRYAILTHFHADFVAGHLELARRVGAEVCLGARAEAEFPFRRLADGDRLSLGEGVALQVLETPGHTPEGISIVVHDLAREGETAEAVLTGDTLFIGDVGRPDLLASIGATAQELGSQLYHSLHDKLLRLPDATKVYPAHGAGSLCGKNLSTETVSTIGEQRRFNYALQPMSEEEFVEIVAADQPPAPKYFLFDATLNRKERPTLDETLQQALRPLSLEEVLRRQNGGAQVLDAREAAIYAEGHLRGSVNVGLPGKYATWAGSVLDLEVPIVVVADPGREHEAAMRLGRIGLDRVEGYLEGGVQALEGRPDLVARTPQIGAEELARRLRAGEAIHLLDVRSCTEFAQEQIAGSQNVPLGQLPERLSEVPGEGELVVICGSGYRSSIACSLLEGAGREAVNLVGGMAAWGTVGLQPA